jgi:hypothetical protein
MTARKKTTGEFTVSGAGVDLDGFESIAVALSRAITAASRATGETTAYVRDADGNGRGRVERDQDGSILVYGEQHYRSTP